MISNPLSVLSFLVSEGLSLRGAAEAIPVFCRGRSVHGLTSPSPRIDLPLPTDPIPVFCRGEASSMRCLGSTVMPFQDASPLPHGTRRGALPQRADRGVLCRPQSPVFCRGGACPHPSVVAWRRGNPVFCRGEAELSKTRSQGFCLAPTAWYAARCKCRHPPCHCEAQPKQSRYQNRDCHAPCGGSQ